MIIWWYRFFDKNAITTIPIKVTFCEIHWTNISQNSPQCIILFCISWDSDEAEGRPCKLATVSILFRDKHPFFKTAQAEPTRRTSSAEYGNTGCGIFKGGVQNKKRFCLKINTHNGNWCNGEVSKSAKIWLSKSIFYVKNHWNLSDCFFHWRISV